MPALGIRREERGERRRGVALAAGAIFVDVTVFQRLHFT
jgi:hypothetical protein